MMSEGTAFTQWQILQKELHELERRIAQEPSKSRGGRAWKAATGHLQEQAAALRERVDSLFPAAMHELEAEVARLSAQRHRLQNE
jgi:hypothetical protein